MPWSVDGHMYKQQRLQTIYCSSWLHDHRKNSDNSESHTMSIVAAILPTAACCVAAYMCVSFVPSTVATKNRHPYRTIPLAAPALCFTVCLSVVH